MQHPGLGRRRFPQHNGRSLRWQWEERVLPYWIEHARIAEEHGCRLCFEMHPSDVIYNPATLVRLRQEIGHVVGCNLDPSHLFWQGIDPVEVALLLRDAVYHVHARTRRCRERNVRLNGVLEATPGRTRRAGLAVPYRRIRARGGILARFRVGVPQIGYDGVVSVENEDEYLDAAEGLEKACGRFLKAILLEKEASPPWWEYEPG